MTNLFFDVIPREIREEIYGIRLSNALTRNYYRRVAQKVSLGYFVLKLQEYHRWVFNFHLYYNPDNPHVRYVVEKCSKIIKSSDDKIWWTSQLIRPIERGLIIQGNIDQSVSDNYMRNEYACDKLIDTFQIRKNPARN